VIDMTSDLTIVIFQAGGADGLSMCVPYDEPHLQASREMTLIYPPGEGPDVPGEGPDESREAIHIADGWYDPTGTFHDNQPFGIPKSMAALKRLFDGEDEEPCILGQCFPGGLAFVPGVGAVYSLDFNRSHFEAMKFVEFSPDGDNIQSTGWITRLLQDEPGNSPLAFAHAPLRPDSMRGASKTIATPSPQTFAFPTELSPGLETEQDFLSTSYGRLDQEDPLLIAWNDTRASFDSLAAVDFENYTTAADLAGGECDYPASPLGQALKRIAAMGSHPGPEFELRVAHAVVGGWDTHSDQEVFDDGSGEPRNMHDKLVDLSACLCALWDDLKRRPRKFNVIVMTEFGRRTSENGSMGTDHGTGSCMMVLGDCIRNGRIYSEGWTGVPDPTVAGSEDLPITTDYQKVIGEILNKRYGVTVHGPGSVFPDLAAPDFLGIVV
jgi:uncharacterized protein (DUF1501 family)